LRRIETTSGGLTVAELAEEEGCISSGKVAKKGVV